MRMLSDHVCCVGWLRVFTAGYSHSLNDILCHSTCLSLWLYCMVAEQPVLYSSRQHKTLFKNELCIPYTFIFQQRKYIMASMYLFRFVF